MPDLLFGAGVLYWLLFALMTVFDTELSALAPIGMLPLVTLFTGVPHYGATLLRVCDRAEDRRAYAFVTVGASIAMIVALGVCLRSPMLGSLLLTLYLTWSPWHYSGQNYGITLMMLGRRGVAVSPRAKRLLHASFFLSFALIVLSINGDVAGSDYAPIAYQGTAYRHYTLGIPAAVRNPAMTLTALAYAAALAGFFVHVLRAASLRDVAPAAAVVASQGLWFAVPSLARLAGVFQDAGPLSTQSAAYAFVWIGVAHSAQYLWVTSYFALRSSGARVGSPAHASRSYLARYGVNALVAGAALWVVPALVLAPGALGNLPFDAGLAVMVSATVNLHHFILDGAIWKLRDGRIARVLLRGQGADTASGSPTTARKPWVRAPLVLLGSVCVLIFGGAVLELELGLRPALDRGDAARATRAVERLAFIGQDSSANRVNLGLLEARSADFDRAVFHLERAVELMETDASLGALASVYSGGGRAEDAEATYRRALELGPENPEWQNNLAWLLATRRAGDAEAVREAVALAERASTALGGTSPVALDTLAVAYAAAGKFKLARAAARRALAEARVAGDAERVSEIETHLALFRAGRPFTP